MIGMFDTPDAGYIKLHRRIGQNAIWENSNLLKVWLWCLMKAHWRDGYSQIFNGSKREIKRGQFLTGRKRGAKECNLPESTFWWCLKKLETFEGILLESEQKKTLVTVLNYESYQGGGDTDGQKIDNRLTTDGQQIDTDEEVKKERREEERYTSIRDHWNSTAKQHGLATVIRLSDKRMRAVDARLKEKDFDFAKIVEEIGKSEFLRGSTGWKVDFDFVFCSANNYLKILEGKYRDAGTRKGSHANSQLARATFTHGEQEIARLKSLKETLDERDRKRG